MNRYVKYIKLNNFINRNKSPIFDIEMEAAKLGMTVQEYKIKILKEYPKKQLNNIYQLYESDIEEVNKAKIKFNNDVRKSKERISDFDQLDQFYSTFP